MTQTRIPVLELEERRWRAMVAADLDELDQLFDDAMVYTHSNGMVDTKASYLGALRTGTYDYVDIDVQEADVHDFGDTVVVTGTAKATSKTAHGQLVSRLRYSGVWSRSGDAWRFVAWHSCPIAS